MQFVIAQVRQADERPPPSNPPLDEPLEDEEPLDEPLEEEPDELCEHAGQFVVVQLRRASSGVPPLGYLVPQAEVHVVSEQFASQLSRPEQSAFCWQVVVSLQHCAARQVSQDDVDVDVQVMPPDEFPEDDPPEDPADAGPPSSPP